MAAIGRGPTVEYVRETLCDKAGDLCELFNRTIMKLTSVSMYVLLFLLSQVIFRQLSVTLSCLIGPNSPTKRVTVGGSVFMSDYILGGVEGPILFLSSNCTSPSISLLVTSVSDDYVLLWNLCRAWWHLGLTDLLSILSPIAPAFRYTI